MDCSYSEFHFCGIRVVYACTVTYIVLVGLDKDIEQRTTSNVEV